MKRIYNMVNTKNDSSFMKDLISVLFETEEDFNIFMDELKKKTENLKKGSKPKSGDNNPSPKEAPKNVDEKTFWVDAEDYLTEANDLYTKKDLNKEKKSKSDTVSVACELTEEEKLALSDKRVCAVSKESIKAILELWKETEKLVFKLTKEFGINIWESQDDTIYNKFNLMIRQFLEIMFTSAEVDILEDWAFGYQDIEDNRPDFDEVWKGILDE
jgi:hypothetical protein